MKISRFFSKNKEKSDFAEFFSRPISQQKKVIKSAIKEANKEQKELYDQFKNDSCLKIS